jgi:hypothetical protein
MRANGAPDTLRCGRRSRRVSARWHCRRFVVHAFHGYARHIGVSDFARTAVHFANQFGLGRLSQYGRVITTTCLADVPPPRRSLCFVDCLPSAAARGLTCSCNDLHPRLTISPEGAMSRIRREKWRTNAHRSHRKQTP